MLVAGSGVARGGTVGGFHGRGGRKRGGKTVSGMQLCVSRSGTCSNAAG